MRSASTVRYFHMENNALAVIARTLSQHVRKTGTLIFGAPFDELLVERRLDAQLADVILHVDYALSCGGFTVTVVGPLVEKSLEPTDEDLKHLVGPFRPGKLGSQFRRKMAGFAAAKRWSRAGGVVFGPHTVKKRGDLTAQIWLGNRFNRLNRREKMAGRFKRY